MFEQAKNTLTSKQITRAICLLAILNAQDAAEACPNYDQVEFTVLQAN